MTCRALLLTLVFASAQSALTQEPTRAPDLAGPTIPPARQVPTGKAPGLQIKLLKDTPAEKVYALIFSPGDELISGLTDFATRNHIIDAHLTGIGALSEATLAWFDDSKKLYRAIPVDQPVEVLSLLGDIATANDKPIVHAHLIVGREDGTTLGGHCFEARVRLTLEVFLTTNTPPLPKVDSPSGIKVIDLTH